LSVGVPVAALPLNYPSVPAAAPLPPPTGITLLPGPVKAHTAVVAGLIDKNEVTAACYTCGHPDRFGRFVRTVGVWPAEMVAVTYLTDLRHGVKVDPGQDVMSVMWEDWLAQMIPVR
jgi:hypothetical protein